MPDLRLFNEVLGHIPKWTHSSSSENDAECSTAVGAVLLDRSNMLMFLNTDWY